MVILRVWGRRGVVGVVLGEAVRSMMGEERVGGGDDGRRDIGWQMQCGGGDACKESPVRPVGCCGSGMNDDHRPAAFKNASK